MVADLPVSSYHASEDIHEHTNIDEASVETDILYIANPDLIASTDVKVLKSIDPGLCPFKRSRGLTGAFDGDQEILCLHQSGNAAMPNSVSQTQQQLPDAPIPICRITPT